jgi:hypothetical protein
MPFGIHDPDLLDRDDGAGATTDASENMVCAAQVFCRS